MRQGGNKAATVVVVAAAVAVTILCAYLLATWPPEPPRGSPADLRDAQPAPAAASPDEGTQVAVLGDSFSAQSDAFDGPPWPQLLGDRLGWEVTTDAVPGTGYVSDADGSGQAFGQRLADVVGQGADVVIVAGGVEDLGAQPMQRIVDSARDVVTTLSEGTTEQTDLVVVSPFSNGSPGPLTNELNGELRTIAEEQGAAYVDATRWLIGEGLFVDPMTPSAQGHQRIATRMQNHLERLGVAEPSQS